MLFCFRTTQSPPLSSVFIAFLKNSLSEQAQGCPTTLPRQKLVDNGRLRYSMNITDCFKHFSKEMYVSLAKPRTSWSRRSRESRAATASSEPPCRFSFCQYDTVLTITMMYTPKFARMICLKAFLRFLVPGLQG